MVSVPLNDEPSVNVPLTWKTVEALAVAAAKPSKQTASSSFPMNAEGRMFHLVVIFVSNENFCAPNKPPVFLRNLPLFGFYYF